MPYAICPLSVVSVRSSAAEKSEQVTQLLFGEVVEILEKKGKRRVKVRCRWDNYLGWVDARQIEPITDSEYKAYQKKFAYCLDIMHPLLADDHHLPVTIGAKLPDFDGMRLSLGERTFTFSGQAVYPAHIEASVEMVLKIARRYLHAPFQWGGRSPFGLDAAGLTQAVFKIVGIRLHREAGQQVYQGESIDFIEESFPGDLAFFENRRGNITHTGILFPEGQIIHAADRVRIDKIDHYGIFDESTGRYTHKLRVIKRILENPSLPPGEEKEEPAVAKNQVKLF